MNKNCEELIEEKYSERIEDIVDLINRYKVGYGDEELYKEEEIINKRIEELSKRIKDRYKESIKNIEELIIEEIVEEEEINKYKKKYTDKEIIEKVIEELEIEEEELLEELIEVYKEENEYIEDYFLWADWSNKEEEEVYYVLQISTGGPGDEIRYFINRYKNIYKIQYVYLDWFDIAKKQIYKETEDWKLLEELLYIINPEVIENI